MNKKELSPPGEIIKVNGRKVHIQRGGTGSPTVIFESGWFADSIVFHTVQSEISKITTTMSYDRAGMGWSEKSTNPNRDSKVIAIELFDLLDTLNLQEPLVLVGWSIGGIYIREFAHQHPEMVSGMVFIDSPHENEDNRFPEEIMKIDEKSFTGMLEHITKLSEMTHEEILKEFGESPPWKNDPPSTHKYSADRARPEFIKYLIHIASFKDDFAQGDDSLRSLGNIPLTVLSQAKFNSPNLDEEQNKLAAEIKDTMHSELAALSTDSKEIKVDCGHDIANEKPEVVIEAVKGIIERVRSKDSLNE
jgi:pimeloyl-ACP methyl ester carboxylesterase